MLLRPFARSVTPSFLPNQMKQKFTVTSANVSFFNCPSAPGISIKKEGTMVYTPQLDSYQSSALRRIAWALDMPMTKAMTAVIEYVSNVIDSKRVCNACRDKSKCAICVFNGGNVHAKNP
jgi:hypothetical protein